MTAELLITAIIAIAINCIVLFFVIKMAVEAALRSTGLAVSHNVAEESSELEEVRVEQQKARETAVRKIAIYLIILVVVLFILLIVINRR